jgi:hypothetical protein
MVATGVARAGGTRPGEAPIRGNHRLYLAMHHRLREAPASIRTHFFAAAACVTHPRGGLGILDGALGRLVFDAEQAAFLRHVHATLARLNRHWFARLRRGLDVRGCEGLRGRALDHALVKLEQARFTRAMAAYFGADAARRERVLSGINVALRQNPLLRSPLLDRRLRAALAVARRRHGLDLGDEEQRCTIGHALVDLVRRDGTA